MKNVGIVRAIDPLGRIVLPMEMRKTMDLPEGTPMEFYVEGDCIILKKYQPDCMVKNCNEEGKHEFGGAHFCDHHWDELKEIARKGLK